MINQKHIVIIGSGIAGITAAKSARSAWPLSKITLVTKDANLFYNKIALMALVAGKRQPSQMYFDPLFWHQEHNINLILKEVTRIDARNNTIVLKNENIEYDSLIIASGAKSSMPLLDHSVNNKIFPLWTMNDALDIKSNLEKAKSIVVIGGGILGIEAALELVKINKQVEIIEKAFTLMPQHLSTRLAQTLLTQIERNKIKVHTSTAITNLNKTSDKISLFDDAKLITSCHLVLLCSGVKTEIKLAKEAGINCSKGIIVDSYMNTSIKNILACGNCIEFNNTLEQLWNPAVEQAKIAGFNALSNNVQYQPRIYPIHFKGTQTQLFTLGNPQEKPSKILENKYEKNGILCHQLLHLENDNTLLHASFLGETQGYYEIEKAFLNKTILPQTAKSINDILNHLSDSSLAANENAGWVCKMCGYTHEGNMAPPICPVCNVGRDQFLLA